MKNIITFDELLNGAIVGAIVSIIVSVPYEIREFNMSDKDNLNNFFWQGVVPYQSAVSEIFRSVDSFIKFEDDFDEYEISRTERNWKSYEKIYDAKFVHLKKYRNVC